MAGGAATATGAPYQSAVWQQISLSSTLFPLLLCQALGEFTLFMPTHGAGRRDGDWGAWAPAWLDAWSHVAHSSYWDRHWLGLFARLAKHDTTGGSMTKSATTVVVTCLDANRTRICAGRCQANMEPAQMTEGAVNTSNDGSQSLLSAGVVDWGPLVPQLYTRLLWVFRLPVGSATAEPPFGASLLTYHYGPMCHGVVMHAV